MLQVNFASILFLAIVFLVVGATRRQTETLRYVGQTIPPNCTASFVCDPDFSHESSGCLRWRVQRITCNKRLVRLQKPSYVEVVTVRPRGRARTQTDAPIEVTTKAVQSVHIIDVPCITGFLPDRNGRCREMW